MPFRVYYDDGTTAQGHHYKTWQAARVDGVQVVISWPPKQRMRWKGPKGPVRDRDMWTGEDVYDPFGWGLKYGRLISDEKYKAIWNKACADSLS